MIYHYIVTVETDNAHLDAPNRQTLASEIQTNLEWDAHKTGILSVAVTPLIGPNVFVGSLSEGGDV